MRSFDCGYQWTTPKRLTFNNFEDIQPHITVKNNLVFIAFVSFNPSSQPAHSLNILRSFDYGENFELISNLDNMKGEVTFPDIFIDDNNTIHLVWSEDAYGQTDIFYRKSSDFGNSWSQIYPVTKTNQKIDSVNPKIQVRKNGEILVAWVDDRYGFQSGGLFPNDILLSLSVDGGNEWSYPFKVISYPLPLNHAEANEPTLYIAPDGVIHCLWWENIDGFNVFYSQSTDGGRSFSKGIKISNFPPSHPPSEIWGATNPSIVKATDGNLYVVFSSFWLNGIENPRRYGDIFLTFSSDNGLSWAQPIQITTNSRARAPKIIQTDCEELLIVWEDERDNNPPEYNTYGAELYCCHINLKPINPKPYIYFAGLWNTYLDSTQGGYMNILAYVFDPDNDVKSVELAFYGVKSGIKLFDDGSHNDFAPNDSIYGLSIYLPPPLPKGLFKFQIVATDSNNNEGWWPELSIYPIEFNSFLNTIDYSEFLFNSPQSTIPIPIAGFGSSFIDVNRGGRLEILAYVPERNVNFIELYYDNIPTGILLKDEGTLEPSGDFIANDGIYTFRTYIHNYQLDQNLKGSYFFTLKAVNNENQQMIWPYLIIN